MIEKQRRSTTDSPKVEVTEIDTRAPFQSVKDAVSLLFGEGAFSGEIPAIKKIKAHSTERVLATETQLHLAQEELNGLKDQVKNAETTKAQALVELENAKRMVEDLSQKLKIVNESKDSAIWVTEASKNWLRKSEETKSGEPEDARNQDLESAWEQYMHVFTELDAAKQRLKKIHRECDASSEAKIAAFNQVAEAKNVAKANMEKVGKSLRKSQLYWNHLGKLSLQPCKHSKSKQKYLQKRMFRVSPIKPPWKHLQINCLP